MNLESLRLYKDQIISIAENYGAKNIRVFGSVAEGNSKDSSDIDFLVSIKPGTSLIKLAGLQNNLEDLLHCKVDIVTDGRRFSITEDFKKNILDKAKSL